MIARWMFRAAAPGLLAWLLPRMTLLALLAAELDAMFPLPGLARDARALPAWTAAAAFAGVTALTALEQRPAVRDLVLGERHALLWRQPVRPARCGPAVATILGPLGLPVLGIGLLYGGNPAIAALWLALWLVPGVLAPRWPVALGASALLAPIAAVAHAAPVLALPLALLCWVCALPAAGALAVRLAEGPAAPPAPLRLRPRSVVGGLVHRDLLVVWRSDRALIRGAFATALLAVPVALMRRARWEADALTAAVVTLLALAAPLSLALPAAAARALGSRFDPPEWPVTAGQRATSLAGIAALALVPGWASAATAAPNLGVLGHVHIAAFVAAIAAGASWWVAARPGSPNPGTWLHWIGACAACALIRPALPLAVALAVVAWWRASARLEATRRSV